MNHHAPWSMQRVILLYLYVTSQILCEFYSVITNSRRVAVASSAVEAYTVIMRLLALPGLHVLPAPTQTVAGVMESLRRHPVKGSRVFDLQIVATMQANYIHRIYTFNTTDFERFPELAVMIP